MRRSLGPAATIALVLLAGCAGSPTRDGAPDAGTTTDTASPPDAATTTTIGPDRAYDGSGVGPAPEGVAVRMSQDTAKGTSSQDAGVTLELTPDGSGKVAHVRAIVRNGGGATYFPDDGSCKSPWNETLRGPDGPVQARGAVAGCALVRTAEFGPGDAIVGDFAWNGTLWEPQGGPHGRFVPAPAGDYAWSLEFVARMCPAGYECPALRVQAGTTVTVERS
jgi:hypothetical protein